MVFTDTITIFNHYLDDGNDKWKRTVLSGCQWSRKIASNVDSSGKLHRNNVTRVTIPYRSGYVDAKHFDGVNGWTLDANNKLDIVVLGNVAMPKGANVPKELKKLYQDMITIDSMADNTNRDHLKHWKVEDSNGISR